MYLHGIRRIFKNTVGVRHAYCHVRYGINNYVNFFMIATVLYMYVHVQQPLVLSVRMYMHMYIVNKFSLHRDFCTMFTSGLASTQVKMSMALQHTRLWS